MAIIKQYGFFKDGVLKILNRKRFDAECKAFKDCDVEITIKTKGKRSLPQNAYYWGVIIAEIKHELKRRGTIATAEEIHEALKLKFNPNNLTNEDTAEVLLEIGGTTTEMNKEQFGEYLDRIIRWCNESLEIVIPEAGQQTTMFKDTAA